jgi:hypothetical protein
MPSFVANLRTPKSLVGHPVEAGTTRLGGSPFSHVSTA